MGDTGNISFMKKIGFFFESLKSDITSFGLKNRFLKFIDDDIVNGKWSLYIISVILILFLFLIYFIVHSINFENKRNPQMILLVSASVLFSIFYFFAYRNNDENSNAFEGYYKDKRKLVKDIGENKSEFHKENFKHTIRDPIVRLVKSIGLLFMLPIIGVLLVSFIYSSYKKNVNLFDITQFVLVILIVLVGLAIISVVFNDDITCDVDTYKDTGFFKRMLCLIINFILFIPCLIVILADEINKDIRLTPTPVYLLFIVLLVLVCLVFFLPILFQFIKNMNKNDLLKGEGPYYLNTKRRIGSYQEFNKYVLANKEPSKSYEFDLSNPFNPDQWMNIYYGKGRVNKFDKNYTYSISFYIYLNPQPKNTSLAYNKETELFNYGNKPVIMYDGNTRTFSIKSKTQMSEGAQLDTIYKTQDIKYQKWIYIVVNYGNNVVDVFMDGKLVGSMKNVPPYFADDKVTIGDDNGIHGSIKDIYYFEKQRPTNDVEFMYDLVKNN